MDQVTELNQGEVHPSFYEAVDWIAAAGPVKHATWLGAYATCALDGNRLAGVLGETLRRIVHCEAVSDRYVLGLAWQLFGDTVLGAVELLFHNSSMGDFQGEVVCRRSDLNALLKLVGSDFRVELEDDDAS